MVLRAAKELAKSIAEQKKVIYNPRIGSLVPVGATR